MQDVEKLGKQLGNKLKDIRVNTVGVSADSMDSTNRGISATSVLDVEKAKVNLKLSTLIGYVNSLGYNIQINITKPGTNKLINII